ncbi:RHS repeat domain-containing protein [Anaerostipes sp.]|uniref:RHS repeat domain-containing protein n=2 Tax=Anaerostipes sp. TaxID=1872530 RepID=UPI0039968040
MIKADVYKGSDVKEATVRTYAYDSYGKVTEIKDYRNLLSDGDKAVKKTYTYDSFDRVAKMVYTDLEHPETVMESYAYSYDKNSNIVEKTQVNNYPQKNEEKVNETKRYTYDKVGNRLAEDKGESKTTYDYNGLDQVTASTTWKDGTAQENKQYAYDKNGNEIGQTNSKTGEILYRAYDAENRLTEVSVNKDGKNAIVQQNRYNGDGQRIQRVEGDQTTNYYYQDGVVSYTTDGKGEQKSQDLLGTDGNIIGTQRYTGNDAAYYVYNKDVQGSTTNLVKDDGKADVSYRYEDFGETTSVGENTSGNETCYTGGRYDETTGLYYLNARYYNPEDGRFLSEDTYRGEVNQPDTQHLYVYCKDNRINYVDPSGHKYSPSKAANYAYKWGMKFNPQYANHTGQGDCTNFVSQCVHAGGKSMKKPLFLFHRRRISRTTSYWYSIKRQEYHGNYGPPTHWKESSSWTAVKDFYTYWKKHGAKIIFCSSKKYYKEKRKKEMLYS